MYTLGIHMGHDSSCALMKDGTIIAAVSEERFTRLKRYSYFPLRSLEYCLSFVKNHKEISDICISSLSTPPETKAILNMPIEDVFSENEFTKKETQEIIRSFVVRILRFLNKNTKIEPPLYIEKLEANARVLNIEHHLAHAASAYYCSGYKAKTLIITADGSGDGISTAVWIGEGGKIRAIKKYGRGSSFGAFYSTVTEALNWWVGDGEGKVMGLAPYGNVQKTKNKLNFIRPRFINGKFIAKYNWGFPSIYRDMGSEHWHFAQSAEVKKLVGKFGAENVAAEAQSVLEEDMLDFVSYWLTRTETKYLATAGGVFLNVKLNQKIEESLTPSNYYIFPDAGDSGLAIGAALASQPKLTKGVTYFSPYLGPSYSSSEIRKILDERMIKYQKVSNLNILTKLVAKELANGKIVGWFKGRMEVGPRALGNRSILMDPREKKNKDIINKTVKFREPFRPFCPSVVKEKAVDYFENIKEAPYMIKSFRVKKGMEKNIPAVTHVDGTARPQTVAKSQNKDFYLLLKEFEKITKVPVLLNTSFNIKGEPVVCTPRDAIKCFFDTGLDILVLENFVIVK